MSTIKNYTYVDAHYEHPTTKKRMRWVRIQEKDVARRIVKPSAHSNCYATVQRFQDSVSLRELKRDQEAAREKEHGPDTTPKLDESIELPDQQNHYHGLYFDFDCDHKKLGLREEDALDRSKQDCIDLVKWFQMKFELNPAHIQIWFSGKKGFHCTIRPEVFGIKPHRHLTYIVKNIANQLARVLKLETLDLSVYTIPRMWRIPNTVHPSTGRYKIELKLAELFEWKVTRILAESRGPRNPRDLELALPASHIWELSEYKDVIADEKAAAWFDEFMDLYDINIDMKKLRPIRPIVRPDGKVKYPVCVQDIMTNGPKPTGPKRNRVLLPIVGFMVDSGMPQAEANNLVKNWTENFYPDQRELAERVENGKSVVATGYAGGLRFNCRAMKGNSGTSVEERVDCVGYENCPWIQDPSDQNPEETPTLHLSDATKGCYMNTKVRMPVHVAAIAGHPFDLPMRGRVSCGMDAGKMCKSCPVSDADGKYEWSFAASDDQTLELIGVHKYQRKGTIRQKVGVPKNCHKAKIEVLEHSNLEEIQIIPMVDFAQLYMSNEDDDDQTAKSYRHVVRRAFHLGHGIKANKKYMIEANVMAFPKDQRVCFVFDKMEPAQNDIDQFVMNPERQESLKVFQRRKGQTVEQKFMEIHQDFTANVHQIGGRFDLSIAIDLAYHSVIGFNFLGKNINKGWFELLICGDTGTGKTTMIERIMQHFGLGELIAGEDSKRTGLVYASIQMQGQWILRWGKIPQNDRRLLVIDEFAGIPQEEVGKMTQLRSEGRARGGGVNSDYETWARTRLILLTNPANNRGKLAGFNYGIQAIEALFGEAQDLRRVDLAMIAEADEVPKEMINRRWDQTDVPHYYTANLCRNLVLWAWSREPHDIEWQEGAEDEVRAWANRLGDVYECDISLAQRSDLRLKIARISAAVAARLFSTDEEARKVLIEVEHVQFAAKVMDRAYRKPSMAYFEYARRYKQDNHFSQEKQDAVRNHLNDYSDTDDIVSTLLDIDLLNKSILMDMVNLEDSELKRLWKFIVGNRLIRKFPKGYRKTEAFTKFLKAMGSAKSGYSNNLDDSFESGGDFGEEARKTSKKQSEAAVVPLFPPMEDPEPVFEDYEDEQPPLPTEEPPQSEQISFFEDEDLDAVADMEEEDPF